jgi:monoamine oxidase
VRANASDLGVTLAPPQSGAMGETRLPTLAVSVGGAPPTADFAASPLNRLAPDEKALSPLALYGRYILKDDPLTSLQDWTKPEFAPIDQMSVGAYLAARGASPEALRMIDVTLPAWGLGSASALDMLRKNHYYFWDAKNGPYSVFKDGTSALTTAMAGSLKRTPLLNRRVLAIRAGAHAVGVSCADGSSFEGRACINTIPPTLLADLPITGEIPALQREAWRRQRSDQSLQICFRVKEPFWEKDGLPASMWTDGPFHFFAHTPSWTQPIGVLRAYVSGPSILALNRLPAAELNRRAVEELVRLRPAARGLVEVAGVMNWSTYPYSKGHVAYFMPGDIGRYAEIVGRPVGAMWFAGEHLSRVNAGLEGACESAETAAIGVLEALGKG